MLEGVLPEDAAVWVLFTVLSSGAGALEEAASDEGVKEDGASEPAEGTELTPAGPQPVRAANVIAVMRITAKN